MRDDITNGLGSHWVDGPVSPGQTIWFVWETAEQLTDQAIQFLADMTPGLIVQRIKDEFITAGQPRKVTVEAIIAEEVEIQKAGIPKMTMQAFATYASRFLTWAGVGYTLIDVAVDPEKAQQTVDSVAGATGSALLKSTWPIMLILALVMGVKWK